MNPKPKKLTLKQELEATKQHLRNSLESEMRISKESVERAAKLHITERQLVDEKHISSCRLDELRIADLKLSCANARADALELALRIQNGEKPGTKAVEKPLEVARGLDSPVTLKPFKADHAKLADDMRFINSMLKF